MLNVVADATYTVNGVQRYHVGDTVEIEAPAGADALRYTYTVGSTAYTKFATVNAAGNASFTMPAANVTVDEVTAYYSFKLDGVTYYTCKADDKDNNDKWDASELIDAAKANDQGYTGAKDGTWYRWDWNDGTHADDQVTWDQVSASSGWIDPRDYTTKELTTGFWQVSVASTVTDSVKADADIYAADGDVVAKGTELIPASGTAYYYATSGTTFTHDKANAADETYTVNVSDTSDKSYTT